MSKAQTVSLLCGVSIILSSCATPTANLPSTSWVDQDKVRQDHYKYARNYAIKRDKKIQTIFYNLKKNTGEELCDRKLKPGLGFDVGVYLPKKHWWQITSKETKEEEEDLKALNYFAEDNVIYVRYVIPNSAADKAGLKPMDKIVSIFGVAAPNVADAKKEFQEILDDNLTSQNLGMPVEIEIERKGKLKTLTLNPDNVCPYDLKIDKQYKDINAYADGEDVYMTEAIIDYMQNDLELAAVMAHELAHNTLGHPEAGQLNAAVGALIGGVIDGLANNPTNVATNAGSNIGSKIYSKDFEFEADYLSVYYVARAGYDYKQMSQMQKKLAARSKNSIYFSTDTHPKPQERSALLLEAAKEIDLKKSFKEPLVPDFAKRNSNLEDKKDDIKWF